MDIQQVSAKRWGTYRIISVQQHTPAIHWNGVPNTILVDWATPAPSNDTIAEKRDGCNAIGCAGAVIENENQALIRKISDSERCDTHEANTLAKLTTSKNIDAHNLREYKDPDVNDNEVYIREHAVKRILVHVQRNRTTHYVVRRYTYTSDDVTVNPPVHLPDQFIDRYCRRTGKRTTAGNARTSEWRSKRCQ